MGGFASDAVTIEMQDEVVLWTLRLAAGDFALESTGANAYPDWRGREHELEMTAEFRSLRTALGDLAGEALQASRR